MRSSHKHGSEGIRRHDTAAAKARASFMKKHPLCAMCMRRGALVQGEEVDHVVPLDKGGADVDANKQTLCAACHKVKTAADQGKSRYAGCDASGDPIGVKW